jgi:hypothetical protein
MKKCQFIGKQIKLDEAKAIATGMGVEFSYDPEEQHIEMFLSDFEFVGNMDKTGRNGYSLEIDMDGNTIIEITKIGHCHMCSGQGSDDELRRFPHKSLEAQAQEILSRILV